MDEHDTEEVPKLAVADDSDGLSQRLDAGLICPGCGKYVVNDKCRCCGARKTTNQVSGQVIWMRNGRVVHGGVVGTDNHASVTKAFQNSIPKDEWPEQHK